ncbi:hypothetical protein BDB00DRAFT_816267 [Zychaea mexicana]|uniref:uncharacterized protein n=1 Tax=Zychaea mexicana TaxID=64656 RepID=UPI0022FEA613|nr:uncharacterized protein BDB00DRAFT_816267 [Zychaea mexicana]KAI9494902.1 hypothetical protein BDB00DRAFT_816267 [Zychaea mexicana]
MKGRKGFFISSTKKNACFLCNRPTKIQAAIHLCVLQDALILYSMSNLQEIKKQHIASLYSHNASVTVIIDGQMYELPCSTPELTASLLVNLPPEFPEAPPIITVSPNGMRHPWIESDVVVQDVLTPSGWASNQVQLGKIVSDIMEEFMQRPPARKNTNGSNNNNNSNNDTAATLEESYGHRPPPPVPAAQPSSALTTAEYGSIANKTTEELEELLTDDVAFELFFNSFERIRSMKTVQEELRNGNENLAQKSLSKEDAVLKLRSQAKELDEEYRKLRSEFDDKERQQHGAFNRFSSSTVLTRLKASVYESDELSESVAQSFLDGNLDHDGFVKQFRELRKVYHLRASKLERAQKENLFIKKIPT